MKSITNHYITHVTNLKHQILIIAGNKKAQTSNIQLLFSEISQSVMDECILCKFFFHLLVHCTFRDCK